MGTTDIQAEETEAPANARSNIAEEIKEAALGFGADVVGVAKASDWDEFVPEGYRPYDLLPGAKSVIVVGARGPTAGAWRSPNPRVMEVLGLDFANDRAIAALTGHIESTHGYQAIQAPGLSVAGHQPPFSYMLAAVLSGLGTRSFAANIVLNPQYGLLYYSACITTLDLPADSKLEQDVCPAPMCVQMYKHSGKTPCMAVCPADDGGCLDGEIGDDGRIKSMSYNRERCASRAMNFGPIAFQKALADIVAEEDEGVATAKTYSDFFSRACSGVSFYKESVAQCFECMRVCPIGRQERKLK
jgi:epoxyqueuosine reductase QueG